MTSDPSCSPLHVQDGQTALYIACKNSHDQIVELLLKKEADVNHQTKVRPLMLVCVFLHEECFSNVKNRFVERYMHNKVTNVVPGKQIRLQIKVSVFTLN